MSETTTEAVQDNVQEVALTAVIAGHLKHESKIQRLTTNKENTVVGAWW